MSKSRAIPSLVAFTVSNCNSLGRNAKSSHRQFPTDTFHYVSNVFITLVILRDY